MADHQTNLHRYKTIENEGTVLQCVTAIAFKFHSSYQHERDLDLFFPSLHSQLTTVEKEIIHVFMGRDQFSKLIHLL